MTKLLAGTALSFVAGALVLAGCSTTQPGNATPATTGQSSTTSSSAGTGDATTTSLDPCTLLTANDLGSYGKFKDPEKSDDAGGRSCTFVRQRSSASDDTLTVSVDIRDKQGIDTVNDAGGGKTPGQLNGRRTVQAPTPPNGCTLALGVGDASRVDIGVVSTDPAKACDVANAVANAVEPKLPKG